MIVTPLTKYRALIVDDDSIVRRMVAFALNEQGFTCDTAADGDQALQRLKQGDYDLLVTDLRMPNRNGHALATSVAKERRGITILVHTSVDDPRLTHDLIVRGIDDVINKPTDYATFAVKARALVERRLEVEHNADVTTQDSGTPNARRTPHLGNEGLRTSANGLQRRLSQLEDVFPLSNAAFDAYSLTKCEDSGVDELADVIQQDASLTAEVLKLANSAHCSPGGTPIDSVANAIVRLGRRCIGELALTVGGRQALAGSSIPWIDRDLLWKRSVAAGLSLRAMESTRTAEDHNATFLCALLHPVGRIVLATLFPDQHRELVERCRTTGEPLDTAEEETFGMTYGQVGAQLLSAWRIPVTACGPLEHITRRFDELVDFTDRVRHQIETVKLAILLARIAVGNWEPWDLIDVPRISVLNRHEIPSIPDTLATICEQLQIITASDRSPSVVDDESPNVAYASPVENALDILHPLLLSLGVPLRDDPPSGFDRIVIDGLLMEEQELRTIVERANSEDLRCVVRTPKQAALFAPGGAIPLPTTVQSLRQFVAE